jgi:hypothetical protein
LHNDSTLDGPHVVENTCQLASDFGLATASVSNKGQMTRRLRNNAAMGRFDFQRPSKSSDLILDRLQTNQITKGSFDWVVGRTERLLNDLGFNFFVADARWRSFVRVRFPNLLEWDERMKKPTR